MAWEIIERRKGAALWAGRDAEGNRRYVVIKDRDDIAVEPTGTASYPTRAIARENVN